MQIEGKVALITGGASGLGLATGQMLIAAGASVVALDLPGDARAAAVAALGPQAAFAPADVTDEAGVQAAVDEALNRFGGLQIVVNCAGTGVAARTVNRQGPMPLDAFTRVIGVNLIGTFNVHPAGGCARSPSSRRRTANVASSSTPPASPPSTARSDRRPTPPRRAASSA